MQLSSAHSPLTSDVFLSTNRLAPLAPSSTVLRFADATILATAAPHSHPTIDFRSKAAAVGVIPLTWTRKEQQPALRETITARLIDRSLRAATPGAHVCVNVFGTRRTSDPPLDALAVNAASAAAAAPPAWKEPIAAEPVASKALLSTFVAISEQRRVLCLSIQAANAADSLITDAVAEALEAAVLLIQLQKGYHRMVLDLREREGLSSFPRQQPHPQQQPESFLVPDETVTNQIFQHAVKIFDQAFAKCRDRHGKAHRAHVLTTTQ